MSSSHWLEVNISIYRGLQAIGETMIECYYLYVKMDKLTNWSSDDELKLKLLIQLNKEFINVANSEG